MSSQCHLKCMILFHKCWVINNKQDMHDVMLQILSSLWHHITRLQTLTSYYKVTNTDIILQSYKHWQCITRLQTLTMYYKVTNTDIILQGYKHWKCITRFFLQTLTSYTYYKVINTDMYHKVTNTDNVLQGYKHWQCITRLQTLTSNTTLCLIGGAWRFASRYDFLDISINH